MAESSSTRKRPCPTDSENVTQEPHLTSGTAPSKRLKLRLRTPPSDAPAMAESSTLRKRPYPTDTENVSQEAHLTPGTAPNKRPKLRLRIPPSEAPTQNTMSLKLEIPKKELSAHERRVLRIRESAARRWIPKLQRPYPKNWEIKRAYDLKLLRQYPGESPAQAEPNFIKPTIKKSERVAKLLTKFPLPPPAMEKPAPKPVPVSSKGKLKAASPAADAKFQRDMKRLAKNKARTQTDMARMLAWECFGLPQGSIETHKEMLDSGFATDDLVNDMEGKPNDLPEWRRVNTAPQDDGGCTFMKFEI